CAIRHVDCRNWASQRRRQSGCGADLSMVRGVAACAATLDGDVTGIAIDRRRIPSILKAVELNGYAGGYAELWLLIRIIASITKCSTVGRCPDRSSSSILNDEGHAVGRRIGRIGELKLKCGAETIGQRLFGDIPRGSH